MNACYEICSRTLLTPISWQYVGPQFPSGAPSYVIRENLKRHAPVVLRNTFTSVNGMSGIRTFLSDLIDDGLIGLMPRAPSQVWSSRRKSRRLVNATHDSSTG